MVNIGIFGATGYTGQELIEILVHHPEAEIVALASQSQAGLEVSLPSRKEKFLTGRQVHTLRSLEDGLKTSMDVAILCLGHGEGAGYAARLLDSDIRVIDLSADFRLKSAEAYSSVYGTDHASPSHFEYFTYGLPELFRDKIKGARAIANPGCYPTTVALAVAPFAKQSLVSANSTLIVDAKSGVSGAGRRPTETTHFISVQENFRPYNVCRSHRHVPEMEQILTDFSADFRSQIVFTPGLLPVSRGMLSSVYIPLKNSLSQHECAELISSFYNNEPFVSVLTDGRSTPDLASVRGTNNALLSVHVHDKMAVVLVAIDNLGKGASGQAVQNLNLMMGFEETCGLKKNSTYH